VAVAEPKHAQEEGGEEETAAAAAAVTAAAAAPDDVADDGEGKGGHADADVQAARCAVSLGASSGGGGEGPSSQGTCRGVTRKREVDSSADSPGGAEGVATKEGSRAEGTPEKCGGGGGGGGSSPKRARTTEETSCVGTGDGDPRQEPPPPSWRGPLTIVTWNLNGAGPRLSKDWHGIADLLRAEKADVVFFQEVLRGGEKGARSGFLAGLRWGGAAGGWISGRMPSNHKRVCRYVSTFRAAAHHNVASEKNCVCVCLRVLGLFLFH